MTEGGSRLRILVNAANARKGGALQVASGLIRGLRSDPSVECLIVGSPELVREVTLESNSDGDLSFVAIDVPPSRSLLAREKLLLLEKDYRPHCVFTIFGPAFVRFRAPHLCGIGNGWFTHATFKTRLDVGFGPQLLLGPLMNVYRRRWLRKSDVFVVEVNAAKQGLIKKYGFSDSKIFVVPNTCHQGYWDAQMVHAYPGTEKKARIITLSAYYRHKNLELIPEVAAELRRRRSLWQFEFVVTLPMDSDGWRGIRATAAKLGVESNVVNIGPVAIEDGPSLYRSADMVFQPSLLESFSANFPEAMAMGCPIVATDLPFAHDICGEAASYFSSKDSESAARAIIDVFESSDRWNYLVSEGKLQLLKFPRPEEKLSRYLAILRDIAVPSIPERIPK